MFVLGKGSDNRGVKGGRSGMGLTEAIAMQARHVTVGTIGGKDLSSLDSSVNTQEQPSYAAGRIMATLPLPTTHSPLLNPFL